MPRPLRIEVASERPVGRLVYLPGEYTTSWLTAKEARRNAFRSTDGQQTSWMLLLAEEIEKVHDAEATDA